jgi:hypothetical protein
MVHPIILKYGWEDAFSDFHGKEAKGTIVAVTGVKGGSGRSFVSVCLAIALSESGVPVLIADCSTHSASAFSAIGKRKLSTKNPTIISASMTTSIEEMAMNAKEFTQTKGHVILDLPPIRSPLHLLGLTLADQILFTTRSDNSFYMWQERTCDMVVMARNLEASHVGENDSNGLKPCWGVMTDCLPKGSHGPLLHKLQTDPVLTWLGEMGRREHFAAWISQGIAPWERSRTDLALKWKHIWDPILNYHQQY